MFIKIEKQVWYSTTIRNKKSHKRKRIRQVAHLKCDNCNSTFTKQAGKDIDSKRCNNEVSHYCSDCPTASLANQKSQEARNKNLKTLIGKRSITDHGYVRIYVQDTHNYSDGYCGSVFEHVMVMENYLKRAMKKGEVVHHIDGDKQNNNISNLTTMTVKEHNKCHATIEQVVFELYKEGIIRYNNNTKRYEKDTLKHQFTASQTVY